ncbi:MAG TPA: helix-turn-helix transcriptional regulator [Verrucomicrobiae bacterium]|nr:helix-turn-helix transcriptional regulator [Verrucomicrobiae bacterium]
MNVVGPQIQRVRYQLALTQEQLAARCQLFGLDVGRATIAQIESQFRCVTDLELLQLARVLDVSIESLYPPELKRMRKVK